jgi:hypothetical protein
MPKVNSSRRRSSGMRPALETLQAPVSTSTLPPAAGDALLGRLAEGVRLHGQRFRELALTENLHRLPAPHQAAFRQRAHSTTAPLSKPRVEPHQVHDRVLAAEDVVEAALRSGACSGI